LAKHEEPKIKNLLVIFIPGKWAMLQETGPMRY